MKPRKAALSALIAFAFSALPALADSLKVVPLTANVYAIVGDLGQRSPENLGNNATFGLVVTDEGTVLIDPGGSHKGAERLAAAVAGVTDQPVRIVINSGGQDHRWLGNGYFRQRGARIIASAAAVADQQERADGQLQALQALIGEDGLAGTEAAFADETFEDGLSFQFGGVDFQLTATGGAHTPGDAVVWLPGPRVAFTGDLVYLERILGVGGFSDFKNWIDAFETMAALKPLHVVPGHGGPADLTKAKADTYDYLVNLNTRVSQVLENGGAIEQGTAVDQSTFSYLRNFDQLARRNAQEAFVQLEFDF